MNRWLTRLLLITSGLFLAAGTTFAAGDKGLLVIVDAKGKEHKVKDWKFTDGAKRLTWLPPATASEALAIYEGKTRPLQTSVLTYLPIASIRSIAFETAKDKETITVRVARSAKEADDDILVGPLFYKGFNTLAIEGTPEGDKTAVEFEGGVRKDSVTTIRFPSPKPMEPLPQGRVAVVKNVNDKYPSYQVADLQVLYAQADGQLKTLQTLYFNDPLKIELGNISNLTQMRSGGNRYEVTLLTGIKSKRVLVTQPKSTDAGSDLELIGFVGRFSAGYRIFPIDTVGEVRFVEAKK